MITSTKVVFRDSDKKSNAKFACLAFLRRMEDVKNANWVVAHAQTLVLVLHH